MVALPPPPGTRSLGSKVAVAVALPVACAAVLGVALAWRASGEQARRDAAEEASALADLVARSFELAPPGGTTPHAAVDAAVKTDWALLAQIRGVRVVDGRGQVRFARRAEEIGTQLPAFERSWLDQPAGTAFSDGFVLPIGGARCATCHEGDSLHLGAVHLTTAPRKRLSQVDDTFRFAMGGVVALGLLAIAAVLLAVRQFVSLPVQALLRAMGRAQQGDFLVRVPGRGDDEVGELGRAFNRTLARITELKAAEIETRQDMDRMQRELALQEQLAKTNGALQESVRDLELLFGLSRRIGSELELEKLLAQVTSEVGSTLGHSEFSVMLLEPGETPEAPAQLVLRAGYNNKHVPGGIRFGLGEGAAGEAGAMRRTVYVTDVGSDPRFVRRDGESGSLVCTPLVAKGELVGVLNFRRPQVAAFDPRELELLESVAQQAALAISHARLFEKTLELSITDALTQTFNRRHLFARLTQEVDRATRYGHPLSVVMIDIDHFKHLNDTSGHPAGDAVLRGVADLLRAQLRRVDVLARYGGEEFFIVLPEVSREHAFDVAEKLRRAVEQFPFEAGARQPGGRVTISVGVAAHPGDGVVVERLVDAVDSALYASKRGGRNMVSSYEPGMEIHPGRERGAHQAAAKALGPKV